MQAIFTGNLLQDLPPELLQIVLSYIPLHGLGKVRQASRSLWRATDRFFKAGLKNKEIEVIAMGRSHSLFLRKDNTLLVCGENSEYQLGIMSQVSFLLTWVWELKYFGSNDYHSFRRYICDSLFQLNDILPKFTPQTIDLQERKVKEIAAAGRHSFIILQDGTLLACGDNEDGPLGFDFDGYISLRPVFSDKSIKVKKVAAGVQHTLILLEDGRVMGCGNNRDGELGLGHFNKQIAPSLIDFDKRAIGVAVGFFHSIVLLEDGTVLASGANTWGERGTGVDTAKTNQFQAISLDGKAKSIAAAGLRTFILMDDGSVFGCGGNGNGELGIGRAMCSRIPKLIDFGGREVEAISAATTHTLFLLKDGSVMLSGQFVHNTSGVIMTSGKISIPEPLNLDGKKAKSIACGESHLFITLENGRVIACGSNFHGELGIGYEWPKHSQTFMQVSKVNLWRDHLDELEELEQQRNRSMEP